MRTVGSDSPPPNGEQNAAATTTSSQADEKEEEPVAAEASESASKSPPGRRRRWLDYECARCGDDLKVRWKGSRRISGKACARCRAVRYCSRHCMAKHWRVHHRYECVPCERWLAQKGDGERRGKGRIDHG